MDPYVDIENTIQMIIRCSTSNKTQSTSLILRSMISLCRSRFALKKIRFDPKQTKPLNINKQCSRNCSEYLTFHY